MSQPESNVYPSPNSADYAEAVTPSDSTLLKATRGVWVGGAGNLSVDMAGDGTTVLFSGVAAGTMLPIRAVRVRSTSTTATLIVALY